MVKKKPFEDAVKKVYAVIIDDEEPCLVDVWWSVNLPNNPSADEVLEDFIKDYYGDVKFHYFCTDTVSRFETGALEYRYPNI